MILQGRNLIVSVDGTAIAAAKSCALNIKADKDEVSSPTTGIWKTFIGKRKSWSVEANGLFIAGAVDMASSLRNVMSWPGTEFSLSLSLLFQSSQFSGVLYFNGFVHGVTVAQVGATSWPSFIYWDDQNMRFVGIVGLVYYTVWPNSDDYTYPSEGAYYYYDGDYYIYIALNLTKIPASLCSGLASCENVKIAGAIGNLAVYNVQFSGNGELQISSDTEYE